MLKCLIAAFGICVLPVFALAQDIRIEVVGVTEDAHLFRDNDAILIGRDETNHIRLKERFVSRSHAKITCFKIDCLLTDLRSTNGTTLNGESVQYGRNAVLGNGDVIGIGNYQLIFFSRQAKEKK